METNKCRYEKIYYDLNINRKFCMHELKFCEKEGLIIVFLKGDQEKCIVKFETYVSFRVTDESNAYYIYDDIPLGMSKDFVLKDNSSCLIRDLARLSYDKSQLDTMNSFIIISFDDVIEVVSYDAPEVIYLETFEKN